LFKIFHKLIKKIIGKVRFIKFFNF